MFREVPDRMMVKAWVTARVKAVLKCPLNCTPGVEAVQVGLPPLLRAAAEDVDALADDDWAQIQ